MGSKVDDHNKYSWVIKNFNSQKIHSHQFIIGGYQWKLTAYPKGLDLVSSNLTLYLAVANRESLSSGWKRHAKVSLTVVNQVSELLSHREELQKWFDEKTPYWGFRLTFPLTTLDDKDSWFLVNGELKILVEIDVLEAIGGTLYEPEEAIQPLRKTMKENNGSVSCSDLLNKTQQFEENVEVYGFLVLPSQVESVKRIFETHMDIASGVRTKSHNLRTTYINVLLGLVKTLCQAPHELTNDDLREAWMASSFMEDAGFKVDWLEKKLHQVVEKKNRVQSGQTQLLEIEQKLLKLKKECSDLTVLLEKENRSCSRQNTSLVQ